MTDVRLYQSANDGEIDVDRNGIVTEQGLETAAYLSLFGGNEEDSGDRSDDAKQFWGNLLEDNPARILRSRFQHLCQTLPATTANLQLLQEAAEADLAWMVEEEAITALDVEVSIPAVNCVRVDIELTVNAETYNFTFDGSWGRQS